jgi:hypothetical protein
VLRNAEEEVKQNNNIRAMLSLRLGRSYNYGEFDDESNNEEVPVVKGGVRDTLRPGP